jgi:hypothetical protein
MLRMLEKVVPYLFPGGRALVLIKTGIKITNSTSPLEVSKNITLTIVYCCALPHIRLAAHCLGVMCLIGASVSCPNFMTVGSAIHLINEIYEEC